MKKILSFLFISCCMSLIASSVFAEGLSDAIRSGAYKGHRYLIAGDQVTSDRAQSLASLYYAPMRAVDPALNVSDQKSKLTAEVLDDLKAMNEVGGTWDFFLLKGAAPLLLSVLDSLGANGLSNIQGTIYCYGFQANDSELASKVMEVSQGRLRLFFVGWGSDIKN